MNKDYDASFMPLIFSPTGGMAPEAMVFLQKTCLSTGMITTQSQGALCHTLYSNLPFSVYVMPDPPCKTTSRTLLPLDLKLIISFPYGDIILYLLYDCVL